MAGRKWEAAKARNPAEIYNEKRRIIFAQMQKDPDVAKAWLDGYRDTLGPAGYAGLNAAAGCGNGDVPIRPKRAT